LITRKLFPLSAALIIPLLILVCFGTLASQSNPAPNRDDILAHLNAAINLYKDSTTKVQLGQQPSDTIYFTNAENLGAQIVRLAFQSARAEINLVTANNGQNASGQDSIPQINSSAQKYSQMESEANQQISDDQSQINDLKQRVSTSRKPRPLLQRQQALEGKLALDKATLEAIQKMKNFLETTNSGGTGLEGSINDLARSVPEAFGTITNNKSTSNITSPAVPKTQSTASTGLVGQLMTLYTQMQGIRSIDQLLTENENVRRIASDLRKPLRDQLIATLQRGKDLSSQPNVSRQQYDLLTGQFDQLSAALLPLSQELMLLDQNRSNFLGWERSLTGESEDTLRSLLFRIGAIALALATVFGIAEAWRRLTFRYIHDPRRRRQFLLLRRFVMGFLIFIVIILGFISEFSSLATFAGFVTAGIAVGLQTVLLSVAAYFFVIGRYGIRVGDRITVAGVTGDVIDVGIVRMYLMELAGTGIDLYSTGRTVVFSNSVLFQATTPLFKQLPGTQYVWHEVALSLSPSADYPLLQKTLHTTVDSVHKDLGPKIDVQHGAWGDRVELLVGPPAPEYRLQFAETGLELVARYPVGLRGAAQIDDKITIMLLGAIRKDEEIARSIIGTPKIRAAVRG
jgi:small-conductance mechanosensitive channel